MKPCNDSVNGYMADGELSSQITGPACRMLHKNVIDRLDVILGRLIGMIIPRAAKRIVRLAWRTWQQSGTSAGGFLRSERGRR